MQTYVIIRVVYLLCYRNVDACICKAMGIVYGPMWYALFIDRHTSFKLSSIKFSCTYLSIPLLPAGARSRNLPVLFLLSTQKSTFCPLAEKLWIGSENGCHLLWWARRALPPCKFWGDRTTCAGCRRENVVCMFFLFFCHAPRPARCSFEGCIVWTCFVSRLMDWFWCGFRLFSEKSHFRCTT